jgi:hypothetical protein
MWSWLKPEEASVPGGEVKAAPGLSGLWPGRRRLGEGWSHPTNSPRKETVPLLT